MINWRLIKNYIEDSYGFSGRREYRYWDGGGMSCSEPRYYSIEIGLWRLSFNIRWYYTEGQLRRIYKNDPSEWHNCEPWFEI